MVTSGVSAWARAVLVLLLMERKLGLCHFDVQYASFNLRCDGLWEETHGVFGCAKLFLYYGKSRRKIRVLASDYYNCRDDKAKELQSVKAHQNDLPTVFVFVILELRMRLRKFRGRVAMWEGGKIINYIREPQNTYARP
ncbi:hypothetical protein Tco_1277054, partial [Tanacetum coccineum]